MLLLSDPLPVHVYNIASFFFCNSFLLYMLDISLFPGDIFIWLNLQTPPHIPLMLHTSREDCPKLTAPGSILHNSPNYPSLRRGISPYFTSHQMFISMCSCLPSFLSSVHQVVVHTFKMITTVDRLSSPPGGEPYHLHHRYSHANLHYTS